MSKYWFEYVRSCYDLVIETEGSTNLILDHDIEAYIVHLMANNFEKSKFGENPVAISMLTAMQTGKKRDFINVGDECLFIHSYPLKLKRWPTARYYIDMGTTAYGMANHVMEKHFESAGKILNVIFNRSNNIRIY
jgi:hypothetical protein